ncbi:MAG: FKBP-type peptidyl-prolyl cis-trans isomerase [Mucilaginibacter sp.]
MSKWLLPILIICCAVAGCTKTNNSLANVKAQGIIDDNIIAKYIADNGLTGKAKKVTDTSGVYYIVLQPGQGNDLFTSSTQVTVGDTGKLLTTGKVFAQTNEYHPSYALGQVILGWRLGLPKIKTGGIVRLLIPSRYAYGPYAQPQIGLPANAVLDFDIQLYNVTN